MKLAAALLLMIVLVSPAAAEPWPICKGGHRAARHVSCVVDGDTLWINGEKLRLAKINAPELHSRCPQPRAIAYRAQAKLAELMGRGAITVKRVGVGVYSRPLVVITASGVDVGQALIAAGLAKRYPYKWCRR